MEPISFATGTYLAPTPLIFFLDKVSNNSSFVGNLFPLASNVVAKCSYTFSAVLKVTKSIVLVNNSVNSDC